MLRRWLGLLVLVTHAAAAADGGAAVEQIVAAERAFAARAQVVNARQAFAEYFAPDALLYAPYPAPAFPRLAEPRDWAVHIAWRPVAAGAASAGDLGWTTGPAEYRAVRDAAPNAYGHYTSVWRREADGTWRVVIDIGIEHAAAPAYADAATVEFVRAIAPDATAADGAAARRQLRDLDTATGVLARDDARAALATVAAGSLRVHRGGALPAVGRDAALAALDGVRDGWSPEGVVVAASADFGYTYGRGGGPQGAMAYLNLWQRDESGWRLIVHVANRVPAAQ